MLASLALAALLSPGQETPDKLGTWVRELGGLADPSGVVLEDDGTTWVSEWALDRVRRLSPAGEELARFGSPGSEVGELYGPRDLAGGAADPEGLLWVCDTGNHRLQAFRADGSVARTIGSFGAGPRELNAPHGIALDAERVYVADTRNDRVQVFDRDGQQLLSIGSFGSADGQLNHPLDVAVDADGNLFVVDSDNHRVQKFSGAGEHLLSFGDFGPHPGFLASPSGIEHHAGLLYVTDRENHRIQVFDREGRVAWAWGLHALRPRESQGKLHYPRHVAVSPSGALAVVAEDREDRLQFFGLTPGGVDPPAVGSLDRSVSTHWGPRVATAPKAEDGSGAGLMVLLEPTRPGLKLYDTATEVAGEEPIEITRSSPWGRGFGQMLRPEDAAIDAGRHWIHVIDPALRKLETWRYDRKGGPIGYDPYMLKLAFSRDLRAMSKPTPLQARKWPWLPIEPAALELSPLGHLVLLDAANRTLVQVGLRGDPPAGRTGAWWLWNGTHWGREYDGLDAFVDPVDLAFSPACDRVYVVDRLAARVRVHGVEAGPHDPVLMSGEDLDDLRPPPEAPFVRPSGIAVAPSGRVFVTDQHRHEIFVFEADGRFVKRFGSMGLGSLEFFKPAGLALKSPTELVVLDDGNHRAQIVTTEGEFVHAFGTRLFMAEIRTEEAVRRREQAGLPPERNDG